MFLVQRPGPISDLFYSQFTIIKTKEYTAPEKQEQSTMVKSNKLIETIKKINTNLLQKLLVVLLVVVAAIGLAAFPHGDPSEDGG